MDLRLRNVPFWIWVFLVLLLVHQLLEKSGMYRNRILDNWLDPILCMPIILQALRWEHRNLLQRHHSSVLPIWKIGGATLLFALLVEGLFPYLKKAFVADPIDAILYGIGTLMFYYFGNNPVPDEK